MGLGGDWVGRRVSSQLPWEAEIYSCLWAFIEQNHRRVVTKKRPGGISAPEAAERSDRWSWFSGITGRATGAQKHFDWRCPPIAIHFRLFLLLLPNLGTSCSVWHLLLVCASGTPHCSALICLRVCFHTFSSLFWFLVLHIHEKKQCKPAKHLKIRFS